ncbi:MAG: adenine phosphoribosyltransferase [Candidatus Omnitrophota bacterium]|nr:MAG: adenine phosphoribosyltransferase [Candidatus Omnitrophota bacterium]HDN86141.1 adenine phosphoribosyltransferase [Candidatus Omnitrophota bacterium]
MDLKNLIRTIPDFPKKGILFRDITTLLNNKRAFKITINRLASLFKDKKIDYIVCAEARGFILGGALAYKLGCGFIPVRKPGKLPYKSYKVSYKLEYGKDSFCIHRDAFPKGAKVLIVDDLLATGGTSHAIVRLVKKLKGEIVGIAFLIELLSLKGRKKLKSYPVYSLIKF